MPLVLHIVPPRILPAFPKARKVKPKGLQRRWKDDDGTIYVWDSQHGRVEKFDKRGHHLGEFDAKTGEMTKGAEPGRRIEI